MRPSLGPRGKSDDLFESASILFASFSIRDFPTFLKSGRGPVEFGKKAFGPSNLGLPFSKDYYHCKAFVALIALLKNS